MKTFFRALALIFAIFFLWAAYLQLNDPDPIIWFTIYGVASLASVFFLIKKLDHVIAIGLAILFFIGVFVYWPSKFEGISIGGGDINNIEQARESLGLTINGLVMLLYAWRIKIGKKAKNR